MLVGEEAPKWASDLNGQWIELDEKHYGIGKMNLRVLHCDDVDGKIRVWGIDEHKIRTEIRTGNKIPGVFVSYINETNYRLIRCPEGLEAKNGEV